MSKLEQEAEEYDLFSWLENKQKAENSYCNREDAGQQDQNEWNGDYDAEIDF